LLPEAKLQLKNMIKNRTAKTGNFSWRIPTHIKEDDLKLPLGRLNLISIKPAKNAENIWNYFATVERIIDNYNDTEMINHLSPNFVINLNITASEAAEAPQLICKRIPQLSKEGYEIVQQAKRKYANILTELIRTKHSNKPFTEIIERVNRFMLILPTIEKLTQIDNETLGMMIVFNMAEMKNSLSYELHIELVRTKHSNKPFSEIIERVNRFMLILPTIEKITQIDDETLSMMIVFNMSDMKNSLCHELHIGKNNFDTVH
uniref:Uncharacterized protein n=1 Tax=Panagrolaimus sp. ES5 TaxID=591445 RepID=A0AC34G6T0_9BILA